MVELNNEKAKGLVIWWVKFRDDELRSSNLVHTTKYEDGLKFDNNQTVFEIDDVTPKFYFIQMKQEISVNAEF